LSSKQKVKGWLEWQPGQSGISEKKRRLGTFGWYQWRKERGIWKIGVRAFFFQEGNDDTISKMQVFEIIYAR
jgi:hypothetical protein